MLERHGMLLPIFGGLMERIFLAILFLAGACSSGAIAQTLEFKGVPLGASIDELRSVAGLADLQCPIMDSDGNGSCWISTPEMTYADQHVKSFSADFLLGRLAQASVETFGGSGELIEQALLAKYGRPAKKYKVQQTIKNGANYKMSVTEWKLKSGGMISIQDHPMPANQMFTSLISPAWIAWQRRAGTATAKAKKDI